MAKDRISNQHAAKTDGAILILAAPALACSLAAQRAAAKPQSETSAITHEPPSIPVEQIVQKFGDRELEFKKERDNYTYTQTFVVQTIDMGMAGAQTANIV